MTASFLSTITLAGAYANATQIAQHRDRIEKTHRNPSQATPDTSRDGFLRFLASLNLWGTQSA
jgi:hypothetical protein